MVVRIDTTSISSGGEFSLYTYANTTPSVSIYAFDPISKTFIELEHTHTVSWSVQRFMSKAPSLHGFMLARINNQRIVKRIGYPLTTFIIGYKPNVTIPYRALDANGNELYAGSMSAIADGFYFAKVTDSVMVIETLGKKFMINRNPSNLNYEISMDDGIIDSSYADSSIGDVSLSDISLQDIELSDATLNSVLGNVVIREI